MVASTIMSNIGLDKALKELNINLIKTDVGDKNVYQALKQNNLSLGGEQSGHIIFLDDATTGDGILTSIKILNILAEEKKKLYSLLENLTIYPQVLKNVSVKDKNIILENNELKDLIQDLKEEIKDTGRILVRASGTEEKIRVMAEDKSIDTAKTVVDSIVSKVEDINSSLENE